MTPASNLIRRVRELALMVELAPAAGSQFRRDVLAQLTEIILRYEADCIDAASAEQADYEARSAEWVDF